MQSVLILSSLVALAVQAIGEPDVQGQVPIAEDELLGTVTAIDSSQPLGDPSSYKFELFPFKGAKCSTAAGGQSSWPTELLRDGGFQYIQKFELDDVDPAMIQAYDPAAGKIKTYNDAFGLRCTKTENIRKYYLVSTGEDCFSVGTRVPIRDADSTSSFTMRTSDTWDMDWMMRTRSCTCALCLGKTWMGCQALEVNACISRSRHINVFRVAF